MEKSICANKVLNDLDSQLGQVFFGELKKLSSLSKVEQFTKQQQNWLKERDKTCQAYEVDCLRDLYEQRITELSNSASSSLSSKRTEGDTDAADKLSVNSKVSLRSVGPIQFGMKVSTAQTVSGVKFKREEQSSHCAILTPIGKLENEINFIAVEDVIVSANILTTQPHYFTTKSNIGIGSSETQLVKAYPGNIKMLESDQVEGNNYKILAFVPKDNKDKNYRILFTLFEGENGTFSVDHFSVGSLPEVRKGCND